MTPCYSHRYGEAMSNRAYMSRWRLFFSPSPPKLMLASAHTHNYIHKFKIRPRTSMRSTLQILCRHEPILITLHIICVAFPLACACSPSHQSAATIKNLVTMTIHFRDARHSLRRLVFSWLLTWVRAKRSSTRLMYARVVCVRGQFGC